MKILLNKIFLFVKTKITCNYLIPFLKRKASILAVLSSFFFQKCFYQKNKDTFVEIQTSLETLNNFFHH